MAAEALVGQGVGLLTPRLRPKRCGCCRRATLLRVVAAVYDIADGAVSIVG
jgi:hypothetical protein